MMYKNHTLDVKFFYVIFRLLHLKENVVEQRKYSGIECMETNGKYVRLQCQ